MFDTSSWMHARDFGGARHYAGCGLSDSWRRHRDVSDALAALDLPATMRESLAPLHQVMEILEKELARADTRFAALMDEDPVVKRLTTCPSIGPITATAFVAALDDVHRFDGRRGAG